MTGIAALRARLGARRAGRALELEARVGSTRFAWEPPARAVSVAGLHGGAGTTTLVLLLAHALTAIGGARTMTIDLAGRSRGGLAVHAGVASDTTTEATCAIAALQGGTIARPYAVNEAGVRVIGTHPNAVDEHGECLQALHFQSDETAGAVARVIDGAIAHHGLLAIDLGMLDVEPLARAVGERADLHVWVLPGRPESLEIAERRLPLETFEPQGAEAICVWCANRGTGPSARRLSALGELRGCPVVRLAHHGEAGGWATRVQRCLSGVEELCELAA